jgi:6-phosphofructokinase
LFDVNKLAEEIEQKVGMEARATILGHLQRGEETICI